MVPLLGQLLGPDDGFLCLDGELVESHETSVRRRIRAAASARSNANIGPERCRSPPPAPSQVADFQAPASAVPPAASGADRPTVIPANALVKAEVLAGGQSFAGPGGRQYRRQHADRHCHLAPVIRGPARRARVRPLAPPAPPPTRDRRGVARRRATITPPRATASYLRSSACSSRSPSPPPRRGSTNAAGSSLPSPMRSARPGCGSTSSPKPTASPSAGACAMGSSSRWTNCPGSAWTTRRPSASCWPRPSGSRTKRGGWRSRRSSGTGRSSPTSSCRRSTSGST